MWGPQAEPARSTAQLCRCLRWGTWLGAPREPSCFGRDTPGRDPQCPSRQGGTTPQAPVPTPRACRPPGEEAWVSGQRRGWRGRGRPGRVCSAMTRAAWSRPRCRARRPPARPRTVRGTEVGVRRTPEGTSARGLDAGESRERGRQGGVSMGSRGHSELSGPPPHPSGAHRAGEQGLGGP